MLAPPDAHPLTEAEMDEHRRGGVEVAEETGEARSPAAPFLPEVTDDLLGRVVGQHAGKQIQQLLRSEAGRSTLRVREELPEGVREQLEALGYVQ
jgi:hypothetical protein